MTKSKTISDEYARLNREMHAAPRGFGGDGDQHVVDILPLLTPCAIESILDYGAGQCKFARALLEIKRDIGHPKLEIRDYDPAVPAISGKPEGQFDLVVCTDVLEHVEPEFLDAVLDEIHGYTRKMTYLVIACLPANKILPDGRNAHLIQEGPEWWMQQLARFGWSTVLAEHRWNKDRSAVKKLALTLMKNP